MKVVLRVDASNRMGIGHLTRCRTLADTLRSRGAEVCFVCRDHPGNLIEALSANGFPVTRLPAPPAAEEVAEDYGLWLGVSQAEDAVQTLAALNGERPDWLVVDHYGLDAEWELTLRPKVGRILVLDDLANRPHDCDLLLDQNFSRAAEKRYRDIVGAGCRVLTGPDYALLRPEYRAHRLLLRERDGRIQRIFAFFGGADPTNLTGTALQALSVPALAHLELDLVVGVNNPHRAAIERQVSKRPNTRLHASRPHLADLMASADLGIGAGGATTWERFCLRLPSLVVSIAENQRPTCQDLEAAGLIRYAGHAGDLDAAHLSNLIEILLADPDETRRLARAGSNLVDALGAARVAEVMLPTSLSELRPLPAPGASSSNRRIALMAHEVPLAQIRLERVSADEVVLEVERDPVARDNATTLAALRQAANLARTLEASSVTDGSHDNAVRFPPSPFLRWPNMVQSDVQTRSIAILSDRASWINDWIPVLVSRWLSQGHRVLWAHEIGELRPADFCFYLSCGRIVDVRVRDRFRHNLVVHESDLPRGKGWSPLTWQILEGEDLIPVTLFEAADEVDSGVVYSQECIHFAGHELVDELRARQADATFRLCERFVNGFRAIVEGAREQSGEETFYRRRRPQDSQLNPELPLIEQFPLLRVSDNQRYPAFFERGGHTYILAISKSEP